MPASLLASSGQLKASMSFATCASASNIDVVSPQRPCSKRLNIARTPRSSSCSFCSSWSGYKDGVFVKASSERNKQPKLKKKKNGSLGIFKFPVSLVPQSLRSLLLDPLTKNDDVQEEEGLREREEESDMDIEEELKRETWIERILELQTQWRPKQHYNGGDQQRGSSPDEDCCCQVEWDEYASEHEHEHDDGDGKMNGEIFSRSLRPVSWSDTKVFCVLAFLSYKAYAISEINAKEPKQYYGLDFVTSSHVKRAEAAAIKDQHNQDNQNSSNGSPTEIVKSEQKKHSPRLSEAAYGIAASAAAYVHSKAKGLLAMASEPQRSNEDEACRGIYKSEMAAFVAASSMTAVVAADEKRKQDAARDLQSLQSSPCEWSVYDEPSTYTRCFIIQGSYSLASWQANLFFEPTKFEETDVLVHRGIYETAKGIYEQFIPEIHQHLDRYGQLAKLQFAGHSLGGSLSLLVHLMLLKRKVVHPATLLPVVTFGSPFVFCGGEKILKELSVSEDHIHSVLMHRDIVPRAFSCNYPDNVAQVLKRLNGNFRSHPCLNKNKMLYSPMGKIFILQPDENSSPGHPFLPPGSGLYSLENADRSTIASALRAFLNSPHPLETLSDLAAYGSEGTIVRDHHSRNYFKAVNKVIKQVIKTAKEQRNLWSPC